MHGYWEHLQKLLAQGSPFASVTLVDVVASAPQNVGAKMLVTADGLFHGTVGGGKIEAKCIQEAKLMLSPPEGPSVDQTASMEARPASRFVEWNLQTDVGMTCGGVVRLFFEAYNTANWPIIIFGAGHCSQALTRLLLTMQCQITVIDPRPEWLEKLPATANNSPGKLRKIHAEKPMAEYVASIPSGAYVLMMTMGHASDQPILAEILKARGGARGEGEGAGDKGDFAYVGVIGSNAKAAVLRRGVLAAGLSEELAARYVCPIGLPIGTNDPAEIAISIAAQLLERRDTRAGAARPASSR